MTDIFAAYEPVCRRNQGAGSTRPYCFSKHEPKLYQKALQLIAELYDHPQTGTGKPERLIGGDGTLWSRRISKKHRLIYEITEAVVRVDVLSAYGHYGDK